MSRLHGIWRRRLGLWLPALVFFLLNLLALVVFQVRFAGRSEVTAEELSTARQELTVLRAERQRVEAKLSRVREARSALRDMYGERLASEEKRLTRIIAEVKDLASRSGMAPRSISYPRQPIEDYGLRQRSFVFSVEGTYSDLRKFIHLLELSDSFLTLEEVSLSGDAGGQRLSIQLRLSTLFSLDRTPLEEES